MKKILLLSLLICSMQLFSKDNYQLLVGTYTKNTASEGIYMLNIQPQKQSFQIKTILKGVHNPSFLAVSSDKKFVYAVGEDAPVSMVNAISLDVKQSSMQLLNQSKVTGTNPCFISVTGKHAITANYTSGNVNVFGIQKDGRLSEILQDIQHTGSSVHPTRQAAPHAHQAIYSPDGKFLLTNDLGTDYVYAYQYNPDAEKNVLVPVDSILIEKGSGPRHLAFSKNGRKIYVLHELNGMLSELEFNAGKFKLLHHVSIIGDKKGIIGAADIHLSPDGKFVYVTNRGDYNEIICFRIDGKSAPVFVSRHTTTGNAPRNFMITNDGRYLIVGNQRSNQMVVFSRDKKTGVLTNTGFTIDIPSPVCLIEI